MYCHARGSMGNTRRKEAICIARLEEAIYIARLEEACVLPG